MRLAFDSELIITNHFDPEMALLADAHYSRRTVGARQFLYSGRKLVIRDAAATILFAWMFPDETMRMDGQRGYNCAIFRNESERKASDVILECERLAMAKWGPNRGYTYVDGRKTKVIKRRGERIIGFCFIQAGWRDIGHAKNRPFLRLLAKEELAAPLRAQVVAEPELKRVVVGRAAPKPTVESELQGEK